jgi:predicted transcriptional regulator
MRTKWSDLKNETMSPVAQRKACELAERDLAEIEMRVLRETLKVTQEELADKLKVTQVAVSRLERRSDMHLSTLRQFVRALGGELEIRAVFAGRSVKLTHIGTAGRAEKRKSRARR